MLEIIPLDDSIEKKFMDYILSDIPRYFFFILDLKQYPEKCQFLIALKNEKIVGLCLLWKNHIAHMRGQDESIVKNLYDAIPEKVPIDEVTFDHKYKKLLYSLVPNPKMKISLHRMILQKEKMIPRFHLSKTFIHRTLSEKDVQDIAKLMINADPIHWSDTSINDFTFDDSKKFTGIFDGHKLICFTLAWIDETAAIISIAATHPDYQNQGLATFLVNETIHNMVDNTDIAIIHVRIDNPAAIKVYSKLGYKVYTSFENVKI